METPIYLAYDGSLNGDWVSRYALRFAKTSAGGRLHVLHVHDGALAREKLATLVEDGERSGVAVSAEEIPCDGDVAHTLTQALPGDEDALLICGTRVRETGKGLLAGTVTERLLRDGHHNVLAIRVVDPGLLGAPKRLLYPMSENPFTARRALPFLQLFTPTLEEMVLMTVKAMRSGSFERLSTEQAHRLLKERQAYVEERAAYLRQELAPAAFRLDCRAVVSDDWPKEILLTAGRVRAQLLFMGATERTLPQRFLFGNPLEQVLRGTPCDVAIFRRAHEP